VDILSGILNVSKVTGLVILHAEKINDLSTESFIAHMFRRKNKWGFIKAVSDSVEEFATGFTPLHKSLKALRLKKVLLWPRFHIEVTSSLMVKDIEPVTEIRVLMTESMKQIQTGLIVCLQKCIDELKRKNPTLSIEYWSIENALDSNFVGSIHMILDPYWHRISFDSKQLVKDIRLLKDLLKCLISYDSVEFYETIQLVLDANKTTVDKRNTESPWLMADESQSVITYAKKRVFEGNEYTLEEQPKWEQLAILLDDINIERSIDGSKKGPLLIMCADDKVRKQLIQVISSMKEDKSDSKSFSFRKMMMNKLQNYLDSKELKNSITAKINDAIQKENEDQELSISRAFVKGPVTTNRRRARGGSAVAQVGRLLSRPVSGDVDIESKMSKEDVEMELFELSVDDETIDVLKSEEAEEVHLVKEDVSPDDYEYFDRENQIIVAKYNHQSDNQLLQELMPSFIVMYDPDLSFIRRVEVYQAIHKNNPAKTYFMYYNDSVEEQNYLTTIRKEKEAFTKLIREKSKLPSFFESDEDFSKFKVRKSQVMNTRIAGGSTFKNSSDDSIVIVDSREFRAPLPGLLYRIGLKVIPCLLTVGDYILTPRVCVERKSISDLIGSFKSGRLYEQAERMSKYYDIPVLLIEFDNNQSFSLEPFSETRMRPNSIKAQHPSSSNRMQEEIQTSIAGLVVKFPKLRILWSSSPYQTAELFLELKAQREEPNVLNAVNAGTKDGKGNAADTTRASNDVEIINLLQNVPGVTNVDHYTILKKVKDINKLTSMTEERLSTLIGDDLGARIYSYIQANYKD
jgi:DNA excision repair protein ERCC-4